MTFNDISPGFSRKHENPDHTHKYELGKCYVNFLSLKMDIRRDCHVMMEKQPQSIESKADLKSTYAIHSGLLNSLHV